MFKKRIVYKACNYPVLLSSEHQYSSFSIPNSRFFRYSFICQGTSTRRQRRDLFGHRVKLWSLLVWFGQGIEPQVYRLRVH